MAAAIMVSGTKRAGSSGVDSDSKDMMAAVHEIFEKMHPNDQNEVGRENIRKGFEEVVNHILTEEELTKLMSEVDADGGGSVILTFISLVHCMNLCFAML